MYIFKYNVYYIVTINELLLYMSVFETRGTENCSNFAVELTLIYQELYQ